MEFLVVLVDVVIAALITWWVWHGWYSRGRLSGRLEYAGGKAACGVVVSFLLPAFIVGKNPGQPIYNLVLIGTGVFIAVTGVLGLAAFVTKILEGAKDREEMRLSGRPVPPRLRAAWKVALISAAVAFVLFMAFLVSTAYLYATAAMANPAMTRQNQDEAFSWVIAGAFGFWAIVIASYLIQKYRIWAAGREYAQLSVGIEHRLAAQRSAILASINTTDKE